MYQDQTASWADQDHQDRLETEEHQVQLDVMEPLEDRDLRVHTEMTDVQEKQEHWVFPECLDFWVHWEILEKGEHQDVTDQRGLTDSWDHAETAELLALQGFRDHQDVRENRVIEDLRVIRVHLAFRDCQECKVHQERSVSLVNKEHREMLAEQVEWDHQVSEATLGSRDRQVLSVYPEKLASVARLDVMVKGVHLDQPVRKETLVHLEILVHEDPLDLRDLLAKKGNGVILDHQVRMAVSEDPVHKEQLELQVHKVLQDHLRPKGRRETLVH